MKKKILALCLVVCLLAVAVIGGTLAYFTDTDEATNVLVAGDLEIVQNEKDREGNDFENQEMWPIVNDGKDENGYHTGNNYVDKIVTVTNEGSEDAYVRTFIAFPAELDDGDPSFDASKNALHWNGASANDTFGAAQTGDVANAWYWTDGFEVDYPGTGEAWNYFQTEIDGVVYNVYVATHATALKEGETSSPSLLGVYLDKTIDSETDEQGNVTYTMKVDGKEVEINFDLSQEFNILVLTEAAQAQGFEDLNGNGSAADDALNEAFGEVGTYCPFGGTLVGNAA